MKKLTKNEVRIINESLNNNKKLETWKMKELKTKLKEILKDHIVDVNEMNTNSKKGDKYGNNHS